MIGLRLKGHIPALLALGVALVITVGIYHMSMHLAALSTILGAGYGLFPIFWIVFPVIFMYQLTVRAGRFGLLQECLVGVTEDSRLQLLLIAFIFGAFFEGAAGFGTPVAVCGTILLGLGFLPLEAAGLALLANTAPVAFGALGTPVIALHGVTGLDTLVLTSVVATLLTPFCILVPFWLIWAFAGFKAMIEVWPAILVSSVSFGLAQLLVARLHGPWLVDISAAVTSLAVFVLFLRVWKPKRILDSRREDITHLPRSLRKNHASVVTRAAVPWLILTLFVTVWGTPRFTAWIDRITTLRLPLAGLDGVVFRVPPVVPHPAPEAAVFTFNWLSATGSGIFVAAVVAALDGVRISRNPSGLLAYDRLHALYDDYDRCANGPRFCRPLLRFRHYSGAGLCANWNLLSLLRHLDRLARRRLHGFGHFFQRSFRKPAEIHRPETRNLAVHDGVG
jgi:lactate permease